MDDLMPEQPMFDAYEEFDAESSGWDEALPPQEPLLLWLLRNAIAQHWAGDRCMEDFSQHVLPLFIEIMRLKPAKGGAFAAQKAAEGADTSRYNRDQFLRAHLLNGVFSALNLLRLAQQHENPAALRLNTNHEYGKRLLIAVFLLHDYIKVVKAELHAQIENPSAEAMPIIYAEVERQASELGLKHFLMLSGQPFNLDDLVYAIHNTQVKWGTLPIRLTKQGLSDSRLVETVAGFSHMADILAYGTSLDRAGMNRLNELLTETLVTRPFDLVAHRVTHVIGVLTAYIHNAVLSALQAQGYKPILFASNGVIYAAPRDTDPLDPALIAEQVAEEVIQTLQERIWERASVVNIPGIEKDGKGIKISQFLPDIFSSIELLGLSWRYLTNRKYDAKKLLQTYQTGIEKGWWDASFQQRCDERVGALSELLAFAEREKSFEGNLLKELLACFGFAPADLETLRKEAQSGGKRYWTVYAAAQIVAAHPHFSPDDIAAWVEESILRPLSQTHDRPASRESVQELQMYVQDVLVFTHQANPFAAERFAEAFEIYERHKANRQANYDTFYSLPYAVLPQEEASVPYKPTPYSQRVSIGISKENNRRGISVVGVLNLLLLQLGMDRPFHFEKEKSPKFLSLYPAYFFTPETGTALLELQRHLTNFDLSEWVKHTDKALDCTPKRVMQYHAFVKSAKFRGIQPIYYPTHTAPYWVQLVVDTGNKKTEVEAWLSTILLSLILSTMVDVKITASSSPIPLFASGEEFNETVFLDAPAADFSALIGNHLTIDDLQSALQRVTALAAAGFDAYGYKDLNRLTGLGQRVANEPAAILTCYQRLTAKRDAYADEAKRYLAYTDILARSEERNTTVNYARELVKRYRLFYQAEWKKGKGLSGHAILRPVQEAAKIIAEAAPVNSDLGQLRDTIVGKMKQIETSVQSGHTDGYAPGTPQERKQAIDDFADYFVYDYFDQALQRRKSMLRGAQFNLLRLACDAVYRQLDAEDYENRKQNNANKENS